MKWCEATRGECRCIKAKGHVGKHYDGKRSWS